MISKFVLGGSAAIIGTMGFSLYFLGSSYIEQRSKLDELSMAIKINEYTKNFEENRRREIKNITDLHTQEIARIEKESRDKINDLDLRLLQAQEIASSQPIAFGDDLLRSFIWVDCLWSLGERSNSAGARAACRDSAEKANPAGQGLVFAAITPDFLRGWSDACSAFADIGKEGLDYFREDWDLEFGNFDPGLCDESLIALTPESSVFIEKFLSNGASLSLRLWQHIEEMHDVVDALKKSPDTKTPHPKDLVPGATEN